MNKKISILAMSLLLSGDKAFAIAGDMRAPLGVIEYGYSHFPLPPVGDMWWHHEMVSPDDECCQPGKWSAEFWMALIWREAREAFEDIDYCVNGSTIVHNHNTTDTVTLGTLIFGPETFKITQNFAGGSINVTDPNDVTLLNNANPFINVFQVTPNFEYKEKGAVWGLRVERRCGPDDCLYAGARISLPFKIIETDHIQNCSTEETIDDIARAVPVSMNNQSSVSGGIKLDTDVTVRLDFLSSIDFFNLLFPTTNPGPNRDPFVHYRKGGPPVANETTVFNIPAADVVVPIVPTDSPVLFVREISGNVNQVAYPFRKVVVSNDPNFPAVPLVALAADGSGGGNGATLYMTESTDYLNGLGMNGAAQAQLFMVFPTQAVNTTFSPDGADVIEGNSDTIRKAVIKILSDYALGGDQTVTDYLCDLGIDLNGSYRVLGVGDTDAAIFVGWGHRHKAYLEALFGVRFPTGTKQGEEHIFQLYRFETGNNRHWEIKGSLELGWKPINWFAFHILGMYSHVFPRNQSLIGTFTGSTIKGIGPVVDGRVSWNYGTLDVNFTFFHPCNPELGLMIGYELFGKSKDHIKYCQTTAKDFLGREGTLDPTVAEMQTRAMLHKIRGEIFNRWNFCELFLGASHSVAGRFAMKETEAHVGITVYF